VQKLIRLINEMAGERLAYEFVGGMKQREETVLKARAYEIKILVGTIKILSTGLNIPRASALYEVAMSSNKENAEQRMTRVLTAHDGKPQPIIRFFLDDTNVRRSCMRFEWFQYLKPKLNPIISERDLNLMESYLRQSSSSQMEGRIEL
jgi:superfamily II DNA or RNA helicase